jgi:hypothetical protein
MDRCTSCNTRLTDDNYTEDGLCMDCWTKRIGSILGRPWRRVTVDGRVVIDGVCQCDDCVESRNCAGFKLKGV